MLFRVKAVAALDLSKVGMRRFGPPSERGAVFTIGLLADPGVPTELAEQIAAELPRHFRELRDRASLKGEVVRDSLTAVLASPEEILDAIAQRREREGWDIGICLTDLPISSVNGPVVMEAREADRVAVLSLPALAGPRSRPTRRAILNLIDALAEPGQKRTRRLDLRYLIGARSAPIRRVEPEGPDDVRFVTRTGRGRWWLLAGMVLANQPWRLVPHFSNALAAAVGAAALATVNGLIWQLSTALGWVRLAVLTFASVAVIVTWLIVHRNLWEPIGETRGDRDKAILYNAATVITLTVSMLICYVALLGIELVTTWFIVDEHVFRRVTSHSLGFAGYLALAWLVTSATVLGGAVGVGFESEEAVRQAAYGQREKYRARQRTRDE